MFSRRSNAITHYSQLTATYILIIFFIYMHFLQRIPRLFRRHKSIQFLIKAGLVSNPAKATFNRSASAFLDLSDPEPRNVFAKGVFEPDFFDIAKPLLPTNGIFFDLGANSGLCSFGLVPSNPHSSYHLFEANLDLVRTMEKTATLYPNADISINHTCVSERLGETHFFLERNQSGQSHVATGDEHGVTVPNTVLDEYIVSERIERIDFMKIDLEGYELPALKGLKASLLNFLVKTIYIEIMPENQERYGLETNAPLLFLEKLGYELVFCKSEDFSKSESKPWLMQGTNGSIQVCSFRASQYPMNHSSDVLAIAPQMRNP